jgi:hypothetical protein
MLRTDTISGLVLVEIENPKKFADRQLGTKGKISFSFKLKTKKGG